MHNRPESGPAIRFRAGGVECGLQHREGGHTLAGDPRRRCDSQPALLASVVRSFIQHSYIVATTWLHSQVLICGCDVATNGLPYVQWRNLLSESPKTKRCGSGSRLSRNAPSSKPPRVTGWSIRRGCGSWLSGPQECFRAGNSPYCSCSPQRAIVRLAARTGFEPVGRGNPRKRTRPTVLETAAIDHSATSPLFSRLRAFRLRFLLRVVHDLHRQRGLIGRPHPVSVHSLYRWMAEQGCVYLAGA